MIDGKFSLAMLSAHSCPVGDLGAKDTGGMSVYIRELAREMGQQGHTVDVYTRVHDPNDPVIVELGENARLIHLKAGQEEEIHKLAVYYHLPEFACYLENFRRNDGVRYDLVFSHYWLSGWVGAYLRRWWQVPHAVMFHTLGALKNSTGVGEEASELRVISERETIRDCQRIIVATQREKDAIGRHYGASPGKIGVVPCGVNTDLFRPVEKSVARRELGLADEKIILFVGRLDPLKGVDRLLEAVALLEADLPLKLIIIGGDERSRADMDKLQSLAHQLGISGKVTFQGLVDHQRLPLYYSAADVCAVPSYYESFGLVALESLSCGTPVVANDVGDMRNIIREGETGYVTADNSPASLASALKSVLSGRTRDAASTLAVRASVESFGWANVATGVIREFEKIVGRATTAVA